MQKLIVSEFKDSDGNPIGLLRQKDGSDHATIMLVKEDKTMTNGFINVRKQLGFVRGLREDLEAMGLSAGDDINQYLTSNGFEPVEIVVKETLEPQWEGHEPKKNPRTGEIIKDAEGNPIYYATVVATEGTQVSEKIPTGAPAEAAAAVEAGDLAGQAG